jgi:outer membrane protein OmpA-like peptidoglycan-associated protein
MVVCVLCVVVAGCSKQQSQSAGQPSAEPSVTASAAATTSPEATAGATTPSAAPGEQSPAAAGSASASPEPTPSPTPSPNPNLLAPQNGAVLRSYPAAVTDPGRVPASGFSAGQSEVGPWVFVYELPGIAVLDRVGAQLPSKSDNGQGSSATFAVSTTGATSGFTDVATISSSAKSDEQSAALNAAARARWVRVTVSRSGTQSPIASMSVAGTFLAPPAINVTGTYVQYANPYDNGAFRSTPSETDPWYLQVARAGSTGINGVQCFDRHPGDAYPGTLDGRTWTWKRSNAHGTYLANDEGTLLVGWDGSPSYWVRTPLRPKYCVPQVEGSGSENVLVLESNGLHSLYPTSGDALKDVPRMRFTHLSAALVDQAALNGASTVVLNGLCNSDDLIAAEQGTAIANWVQNGHKLLIVDSDMCDKPTHYSLLPYPFDSNNPGAHGAKGDRLILVEDDSLGTSDKSDKAHFFDPLVYAQNGNQLGDANTVTTHDPHWCGHLFGTNVNHVNGFMQMYAPYGKGLIVYDGFDHDDGSVPSYQRIRQLELAQSIPPDLPCTQKASLAFVIQPNRDGNFTPGKPATLNFAMELLANQGWKGHVTMTTSGDFRAAVTPSAFDVNGGTQPLKVAVTIPGSAKPGTYAVIVNGDAGAGQNAQATIQLHAAIPLVKQLKSSRRIRVYGIHFDVDKATIKPQSEPVIAQIAQVMQQNPAWRFRVEGHTDSDGGLQHNQVLSQHRAESVVSDLVKRYHIARGRLVPVGYGYSKPVAPNTTSAGKALNRRVELYLLNAK